MKAKPIYVEIPMMTDMETLWEHTQKPELHQQWDLRFSEIKYLPRDENEETQKFLYRTRIGFGIDIAGTGVTKASTEGRNGQRTSALAFGSNEPISLIREGAGYWQYKLRTDGAGVVFITKYDYRTRFGLAGKWVDRWLFRPLFGYATAWSFDMLRLWVDKKISPAASLERAFTHYFALLLLVALWLYQGIVPKLMFPNAGEMELLRQTGWFKGMEEIALPVVGIAEIGFAILLCLKHRERWVFKLQAWALLGLGLAAIVGNPDLLQAPFNPLTLSIAMFGMGVLVSRTIRNLPDAGKCRRQPDES
ncbi:DoxX-like family protein [Cohnella herbarum]|uniref:DoxX-like family protein n=1 Tax=Cohnella herbarum TaxID=2728023 RepID=A0A7Z2VHP4_9BACL|nr:DoxX-like family protein [Cohnella herbarum]QJD83403.1 hypothetical protein HH215_09580 [Cohnella herbarum]